MVREEREVFDDQNWVPWIGLALVVPAIIVLLVGVLGLLSGIQKASPGQLAVESSPGLGGVVAGSLAAVGTFSALMLGLVGLVRALRRPAPHNGRSVGIAGFTLEVGLIVLSILLMALLGFMYL